MKSVSSSLDFYTLRNIGISEKLFRDLVGAGMIGRAIQSLKIKLG